MSWSPLAVTWGARSQRLFTCEDALPGNGTCGGLLTGMCGLLPGRVSRRRQGSSPESCISVLLILPRNGQNGSFQVTSDNHTKPAVESITRVKFQHTFLWGVSQGCCVKLTQRVSCTRQQGALRCSESEQMIVNTGRSDSIERIGSFQWTA